MLKTVLKVFFVAYFIVLYGLIVPAHGHENLLQHHGCVLCQLSGMVVTVVDVFVFALLSIAMATVMISTVRSAIPVFAVAHPTRAPPRF